MVIYISENNNTRVVKPTEGRRGPQMSAPPLAPTAIHSAPTPVARQRRGQRHQRVAGKAAGWDTNYGLALQELFGSKKEIITCDLQQVGQSSRKSESADFCHQQSGKRFALSNTLCSEYHNSSNAPLRQAGCHPSSLWVFHLQTAGKQGRRWGRLPETLHSSHWFAITHRCCIPWANLGLSHLSSAGNASVHSGFQVTMNDRTTKG